MPTTPKTTQKAAESASRRLMIIDGNAVIHRCFHAIPPLSTKEGVLVNAVYGFLITLFKAIKDLRPTHIAVTFDMAGGTFRHDEYKEYKAKRTKAPDELYAQIPLVKEVLVAAHIPVFEKQGFEADDVIGTIATLVRAERPVVETFIVTGDMDALQLVDATTRVYTMRRGINDTVMYDEAAVRARFGFGPVQVVDYKALRGDTSDNIIGVKGVGEKTGMELVKLFGSIEAMYMALEAAEKQDKIAVGVSARLQKLLIEHKESAVQSKWLATIVCDVPIDFSFGATAFHGISRDDVFALIQKLGFLSLLSRLPGKPADGLESEAEGIVSGDGVSKKSAAKKIGVKLSVVRDLAKTRALVGTLLGESRVAVHLMKPQQQDLFGMAPTVVGFAWPKHMAAVEIHDEAQWDELGRLFMDKRVGIIGHDVKQLMHELAVHGLRVGGTYFDILVAAYLLQAGTRSHDLPNLVITLLGEDVPVTEWTSGDPERAARAAERVWRIAEKLEGELPEKGAKKLFEEIEMPLVAPLARMERYGIELDKKYCAKLDKKFTEQLAAISEKIYKLAGREFNIASPSQVSEILFEDLKLSTVGIKRGKTGISTAAGELDKLQGKHPIVDQILEHREISKLLNTYVQALPKLIAADGRVHTTFNQAVAATGRLSSSNPNLQNIPVRTDLGRDIRRAFVAADGYELLSCDYSQFELRIAAHLAHDKKLIDIFEKGLDVHTATAAEINGVEIDDVTKEMRYAAKEVNFGVMYGMGAWGLAERTGLSREEARAFIDKYMQTFSGVARFIEETKASARRLGYVETLFGRRRYLPELMSGGVPALRAAGERMAVNMPIQGTQADVLKMAMIEIDALLCRDYGFGFGVTAEERECPARMLLQVHDELIFEIKEGLVKELTPKILEIMTHVVKLAVPIKVDSVVGKTWADLD